MWRGITEEDEMSKHASSALHPALKYFDELPNSAYVSIEVVSGLYDKSYATIWRQVRDGLIPAPHKLGKRTTRWNVGDLRSSLSQ